MNNNQYTQSLLSHIENSKRPGINEFLKHLYEGIERELNGQKILEIGSGPGLSKKFLEHKNLIQTDLLNWPSRNVIGGIDATKLPFARSSFDSAFCVDAIHHINYPARAIIELIRVVKPGGKIIVIEPYVSYLSYWVYKLFHDEQTTWKYKISKNGRTVSTEASSGEQSVLQSLLSSDKLISDILLKSDKKLSFIVNYFSPISFFASGGLSRPLPTPRRLISFLIKLEEKLPQVILKLLASRQILIISVDENLQTTK
jgi:SAM-dependent methyltransferase